MKSRTLLVTTAILSAFAAQSFASTTIIESRVAGGAINPLFVNNGAATTSAKSTAAGLTGTGSYYAGQTSPFKSGTWKFTPTTTGYYSVDGTWAVNAYAAGVPAPLWTVNNAGSVFTVNIAQTSGGNAWNSISAGLKFDAATTYNTVLQTVPDSVSNKRTYFDSVRYISKTPTAVANGGPANGAIDIATSGAGNDLSWSAGSFNSFFDVWFGLSGNMSLVTTLAEGITTWDPGTLLEGATYDWRIDAVNVDSTVAGSTFSFTTMVPEPSTALLGLLGGLGMIRILRRRTA